jgi:hypothetical protein
LEWCRFFFYFTGGWVVTDGVDSVPRLTDCRSSQHNCDDIEIFWLVSDEAIVKEAAMVTTEISQVPLSGVMALLNSAK